MDEDTKAQAVTYILEYTKTRNYRKHLADDLMNLIVRDILTAMNEWEGLRLELVLLLAASERSDTLTERKRQ